MLKTLHNAFPKSSLINRIYGMMLLRKVKGRITGSPNLYAISLKQAFKDGTHPAVIIEFIKETISQNAGNVCYILGADLTMAINEY